MKLSLILGAVAALADIFGGLVLVRRTWEKRYLRYFVALGAGFMMAAAFLEMLPESFRLSMQWAPCDGAGRLLRHPFAGAHHHAPLSFW